LKEKMEKSRLFRMKYDKDPGLQPGQLRYDALLKTLTALRRFPSALAHPPTELYAKMENICAETFNYTQDQKIGVSCSPPLFVRPFTTTMCRRVRVKVNRPHRSAYTGAL